MYRQLIVHLIPYVKPHKGKAIGAVIFSFAIAAVGGLQIRLVKPLFDRGLNPTTPSTEIWFLAAALFLLGCIHFPCRFYHFYWIRFIVDRATCTIRQELFEKIQRLPIDYFNRSKKGQLVSCLVNDTFIYSQGFKAFVDLIREPLKAVVYMGMAFWADWQLTVVILLTAPLLLLIFHSAGQRVKNNQGYVQTNHGEMTHNISEGIDAQKIIKSFNLQSFCIQRFMKTQDIYFRSKVRTTFVEEMAHPLVEIVGTISFSLVIVLAHHRIQTGGTSIGEFVAFIAALALFMDPVRKLSQANIHLSQAAAAYERMKTLLDQQEESDEGRIDLDEWKDSIEIDNVTFSYGKKEKNQVIKDLSLTIKKGQKVALVGLSGSGKSTFFHLLLRLYPIEKGEIRIDGIPLGEIKLRSLRRLFGFVSQDIFLLNDTVLTNLTMGRDIARDRILKALNVSHCDEFVEKLPNGIETVIGDRGILLSGGQQQRLTIARAFLQDAEILLFDEATSALDNESEKIVQDTMDNIAHNKTVIAIAHRLSTIQHHDQIFVLDQGKLIERGTHGELIALKGNYFRLYELSTKR